MRCDNVDEHPAQRFTSESIVSAPPTSLNLTLPASKDESWQPVTALLALMSAINTPPGLMAALVSLPQILHLRSNASCLCRSIIAGGLTPHNYIRSPHQSILVPPKALTRLPSCTADVAELRTADAATLAVSNAKMHA